MAEWLRRLTRNQFPSGSAGSNPADCENFSFDFPTIVTRKLGHSLGHDRNSPFNPRAVGGKKQLKHDCGKRKADPRDGAKGRQKHLETGGIDPPTSHMLSERSTI